MHVYQTETTAAIISLQILYVEFPHAEFTARIKGIPRIPFTQNDVTNLHTPSFFFIYIMQQGMQKSLLQVCALSHSENLYNIRLFSSFTEKQK